MAEKIQFLLVNKSNIRRHSAPAASQCVGGNRSPSNLSPCFQRQSNDDFDFCFAVFFEDESESCSSLELDTSHSLKEIGTISESYATLRDSYENLPLNEPEDRYQDQTRRSCNRWPIWKNILLSHLVAVCLAAITVSNISLQRNTHLLRNGQNLPFYVFLTAFWTTKLALRNRGQDIVEILRYSGLRYLFLGILHVEVNYLLLSTFRYDSYFGNQTIDCVAAILSLFIAFILLEVRFRAIHISGFILTLIGCWTFTTLNLISENQSPIIDGAMGDVLRMGSGVCLAYSSAAQEILVKATDAVEYTGMIALIASFLCFIQTFVFEEFYSLEMVERYWVYLFVYSTAQFFFHSFMPGIVRDVGATGFHLMLVSACFYSHCIGYIIGENNFQVLYLFPYMAITVGSSLFAMKKTPIQTQNCFPIKTVIMK